MLLTKQYAAFSAVMFISGCATQGVNTFQYSKNSPKQVFNEVQIRRPYSQVWDQLVRELSKSFYVISNIDRESRIINVSFSSNEPSEYVDCGRSRRTYREGDKVENYDYAIASSSSYKIAMSRQEHPAFTNFAVIKRDTNLEGRTNIYLAPVRGDDSVTLVTVNTRYILSIKVSGRAYAKHLSGNIFDRGPTESNNNNIAFNTNKPGEKHYSGLVETMTCFATGRLEQDILQMVR